MGGWFEYALYNPRVVSSELSAPPPITFLSLYMKGECGPLTVVSQWLSPSL